MLSHADKKNMKDKQATECEVEQTSMRSCSSLKIHHNALVIANLTTYKQTIDKKI
jgi:hypothetical protein